MFPPGGRVERGSATPCATTLVSGETANSPEPLEPPAPDQILICCAHPTTDVVLDM